MTPTTYLAIAVALLIVTTYWAATQMHELMEVRRAAHAVDRISRID